MKSSNAAWQRRTRAGTVLGSLMLTAVLAGTSSAQGSATEADQLTPRSTDTTSVATAAVKTAPQALTLATAQQRARTTGYAARAAQGLVQTSAGATTSSLQAMLPSVRVEAGYIRTNEPLSAFGSTLQQRNVSAASFSPAALNYPAAVGSAASALVMELPLINADAWRGRKAAQRAVDATESSRDWSLDEATLAVTQAYFAAVHANARAEAFASSLAAAASQVRQVASQLRNGVVTRSDALLAEVHESQVKSALVAAKADAQIARVRLAMAMGTPSEVNFTLPDSLPDTKRLAEVAGQSGVSTPASATSGNSDSLAAARSDVRAARLAADATRLSESGAHAAFLPRLNAMVRMDRHTVDNPIGGRGSWTVGLMMSWSPFANPAIVGALQSERGRITTSEANADGATARAQLDILQTQSALSVALTQLSIVEDALQQAVEAHRIIGRKYDGGISTITELLAADAVETETRIGTVDARFQVINAIAQYLHAKGATLAPLTAFDTQFASN